MRAAALVSDDVALELPDLARLKVEIFLPTATGPCTCHLTGVDELAPPAAVVVVAMSAGRGAAGSNACQLPWVDR